LPRCFLHRSIRKRAAYYRALSPDGGVDRDRVHCGAVGESRPLGHLYGYPDYAIDFFVESSESQKQTGKFVERDFRSFPSFSRAERGVVYAVAKDQAERPEDREFGRKIETILKEYRGRRERFIGPDKPWVIAMLRDWFCGDSNLCAAP
jgi:hypothetical protein